jgi:hypothetical protein
MTDRTRLPDRRFAEAFDFEFIGVRYTAHIGRNIDGSGQGDGSIREIFLSCSKAGSDADGAARHSALLFSLCLQYGVPLATIRDAFGREAQPSSALHKALQMIGDDCR